MIEKMTDTEAILEAINAAVITIDAKGCILEANAATKYLLGYSSEALIGNNVNILMPEHHKSAHDGYITNYLETGDAHIIGKGRNVEARRADGRFIMLHLSVAQHTIDGQSVFTGIMNDLSFQTTLDQSNERLSRFLNESLNEVYVFDAHTLKFKDVNTAALRNLGYTRKEFLELTPLDIKPLIDHKQLINLLEPLLNQTKRRIRFSTIHRRKDGTDYDIHVSLSYSRNGDKAEFFAIIEDETERNQLIAVMQQTQKMESVGQLTGGIAHDFNNLLTVITGNLELLKTSTLDETQQDLINDAKEAADMGARLTSRLLAFSSRSSLTPSLINLNEMVIDTSIIIRRSLGDNISVNSSLAPDIWPISVDVSQLENALLNLAVNARDAMPDGGKLMISTSNQTVSDDVLESIEIPKGDYATISVADTGMGIPEENLTKLFDPFFTTKPASLGTGLGLSMVYGFTRQSGGCVRVRSEPGSGAEFVLYLPRVDIDKPFDEIPVVNKTHVHTSSKTILLVEDEDRVRKTTRLRLEKLGHVVISASNGYDALQLYKNDPDIEIILSDMIMAKGMTGHDLAVAVRKLNESAKVIISSGYSDELLDTESLARMGIELLRKPYTNTELESAISRVFS